VATRALGSLPRVPYTDWMRPEYEALVEAVTKHYLTSGDFNGTSVSAIQASEQERRALLVELVQAGKVTVEFGDDHPNAFIKAFPSAPVDVYVKKLASASLEYACVYPSPSHLSTVVDQSKYAGQPYTLRMALGDGQLEYVAFDLAVLERYRNDPRYHYDTDDFTGKIVVKTEHYLSDGMLERDKVLIEKFGFGYDKDKTVRVVVAFLRYFQHVSRDHQQLWKAYELPGEYLLHPVYRDVVVGNWYTGVSIFQAITEEMQVVNEMVQRMGRPPLFKEEYTGEKRPRKFGFLLRPTLEEFNAFVQLLEKMTVGNMDFAFFQGEVSGESLTKRKDGSTVATPKGSISALKEWFEGPALFKAGDANSQVEMDRMFATFRKIRALRQAPAHAMKEDEFDQAYFRQQRELVIETYDAVRALRMAFGGHPDAEDVEVPKHLLELDIYRE
jgi:hypothetical protein